MKRKLFYLVMALILVVTLVTLTGCGEKEENEDSNEKTENVAETKTVKLADESKPIVYTVKEENGYKIPAVNLEYDSIEKLNKEISEYGEKRLNEIKEDEADEILEKASLDYKYYENDNIVSIVYEYSALVYFSMEDYQIWNIDKYTGEVLNNSEIIEQKGMKIDDFREKYREQLGAYYEYLYESVKGSTGDSIYEEQYEKTVSDENCDINNLMYLNENNEICMISKIYSLAGADYYLNIVNVENPEANH